MWRNRGRRSRVSRPARDIAPPDRWAMAKSGKAAGSTAIAWGLKAVVYVVWIALIVVAPLAAAWVASSLAAHAGGSTRVASASALLFFPVLPVGWEIYASWRRARRAV